MLLLFWLTQAAPPEPDQARTLRLGPPKPAALTAPVALRLPPPKEPRT